MSRLRHQQQEYVQNQSETLNAFSNDSLILSSPVPPIQEQALQMEVFVDTNERIIKDITYSHLLPLDR